MESKFVHEDGKNNELSHQTLDLASKKERNFEPGLGLQY